MKTKLPILLLVFFLYLSANAQTSIFKIDKNWTYKENDASKWHPAKVPGTVHADLYSNEFIPHPFSGNNELSLQWISDKIWLYQTEFSLSREQLRHKNIILNFDGLDTYAKVYLNDLLILETNNAFRSWKKDVRKILKSSNSLRVEFTPTSKIEERKKKQIPYQLSDEDRVFTRKAQFQYGWDWAPTFNTFGIWRDVYLEFWNHNKIEDLYIKQINLDDNLAKLSADFDLLNPSKDIHQVRILVNGRVTATQTIDKDNLTQSIPFQIENPTLWWTHNLGNPYLYEFRVQLINKNNQVLSDKTIQKGLRTIELITEKDEFGESFYFKLNGQPIYIKGANYVPQNSFQNWVKKSDYDKLIDNAVESNMNMLRVWGGGIYEDNYFYQLCDEKGILVWQDFMFSAAMYPGDNLFLENVKQEAIYNVKRLRNHTSIALWCGNNEISEGWHRGGWQHNKTTEQRTEIWGNYQKLFNNILPNVVSELSSTAYWESSPKIGRGDQRYLTEGDAHDWWIWRDGQAFEELERKTPRFMSEFGFQSYPTYKTVQYVNNGASTSITSNYFKTHQKHPKGFETINYYMSRDFPIPTNEEDYIYISHLLQAYGIGKGIEAQRRNKPYTMGSLYWQLNDCWPAASWSGIDFFGHWKALQYQVRHSYDDILISFERNLDNLKVFVINDLARDIRGELKIEVLTFDGTKITELSENFLSTANSSTIAAQLNLTSLKNFEREILIKATFSNKESIFYFVKPKDLLLKQGPIQVQLNPLKDGYELKLFSNILQKNVMLYTNVEGEFSDNYFDLLPNKIHTIQFKSNAPNFERSQLKFKTLNSIDRQNN